MTQIIYVIQAYPNETIIISIVFGFIGIVIGRLWEKGELEFNTPVYRGNKK